MANRLNNSQIHDPEKTHTIIKLCYIKMLNMNMMNYSAVDNYTRYINE